MEYLLAFVLVFLVCCGDSESATNSTRKLATDILNSDVTNSTSKRTVQRYHSAMDQIMAVNSHRHKHFNEIQVKRMNINGKNESADEEIIQVNKEQKTADDLMEGDIMLNPMVPDDFQLIKLKEENKDGLAEASIRKRQATRQMKRLWLDRRVPYQISFELYGSVQNVIERTIQKFNTKSCVKFVPRRNEKDYVIFQKEDGCYSRIGRAYVSSGYQVISIGTGCDAEAIILHEMLHCVGFYHEQSRPDRNKFLEIIWENIQPNLDSQFLQYGHGEIDQFGIGYNYKSIMHYGRTAFTKAAPLHTMEAIGDPNMELGNIDMTQDDVLELNALYDCKTTTYNSWTSWSTFGPCDSYCYKRRQRYCYGSSNNACGGKPNAYGIENDDTKCNANECPVRIDGHWGRWSPWGYCSANCNEGVQSRKRTCDDPKPANGGVACPHSMNDYMICLQPRCTLGEYGADFRDGLIGRVWRNDAEDTPGFDWLIGKWDTSTENTGPPKDHSSGTGYYLYVESSGRASKDNARLISLEIPPASGENMKCMKFFYHMYGRTTGTLSLTMYPTSQQPRVLFLKSGSQGNKWIPAKVLLSSSVKFQLVFEAVIAGATYSDIAIDDVFIDDGDCNCQDEYRSCSKWAEKGDCVNSYVFMAKHCERSCSFCGCRDKDKNCPTWGIAQCKHNPDFMETKCPLTCRVCSCHDDDIRCLGWAKGGECKTNPSYMSKYCRKSCGICT